MEGTCRLCLLNFGAHRRSWKTFDVGPLVCRPCQCQFKTVLEQFSKQARNPTDYGGVLGRVWNGSRMGPKRFWDGFDTNQQRTGPTSFSPAMRMGNFYMATPPPPLSGLTSEQAPFLWSFSRCPPDTFLVSTHYFFFTFCCPSFITLRPASGLWFPKAVVSASATV